MEGDLEVDLSFFSSAFGDKGSIDRITEDNLNVAMIMKAALRSLAKNHLKGFHVLTNDASLFTDIIGSGGVLRKSKYLQRCITNEFNKPIRLSSNLEDALVGHSIMARQIYLKNKKLYE